MWTQAFCPFGVEPKMRITGTCDTVSPRKYEYVVSNNGSGALRYESAWNIRQEKLSMAEGARWACFALVLRHTRVKGCARLCGILIEITASATIHTTRPRSMHLSARKTKEVKAWAEDQRDSARYIHSPRAVTSTISLTLSRLINQILPEAPHIEWGREKGQTLQPSCSRAGYCITSALIVLVYFATHLVRENRLQCSSGFRVNHWRERLQY